MKIASSSRTCSRLTTVVSGRCHQSSSSLDSHSFMNENDESQWRKRSLRRARSGSGFLFRAYVFFSSRSKKCPGLPGFLASSSLEFQG